LCRHLIQHPPAPPVRSIFMHARPRRNNHDRDHVHACCPLLRLSNFPCRALGEAKDAVEKREIEIEIVFGFRFGSVNVWLE
jgi:hypothetical protein